ncbi:MAG: DNA polymerase III subunit delta', partial [Nitratireductor sp.]|nr:DNA polymerase III subunit delta' [Nitratireductor sp.]
GVLPAWDRMEGIPDPLENRALFGHEATLDLLASRYASGRMHHAWLISGPRGIGKATLAARFAGHVFRHPDPSSAPSRYEKPGPDDAVEALVARNAHPNYLHMRRPWNHEAKRFRSALTVDEIRRTVSFFGTAAGQGGWRVAVVDTVDDLNATAANALLKILEEPPPRTLFLVLANAPRMLATIRSRCQKIAVKPPSQHEIIEALSALGLAEGVDRTELELAAGLAAGSVRRAIVLVTEDGIGLYRRFAEMAQARSPRWDKVHELAGEVSAPSANDRYRLLLDIAHDYVARRIRSEPEPGGAVPGPAGPGGLAGWVEVWEKTRRSAQLADEWNLDRKQVILNLFSALHEAA